MSGLLSSRRSDGHRYQRQIRYRRHYPERREHRYRRTRSERWGARAVPGAGALNVIARVGFAARGIVYGLIGLIALMLAFGYAQHEPDRVGALEALSDQPFGYLVLWLLVFGFAGLALWRLAQAFFAPFEDSVGRRLSRLARGIVYAVVFWGTLQFVLGRGDPDSPDREAQDASSRLLAHGSGQVLLAVVGVAIVVVGVGMAVRGLRMDFTEHLRMGWMRESTRRVVERLGLAGYLARGAVVAAIGVFVLCAALTDDAAHVRGLDATLRSFADTAFGPWLLVLVALGLVAFGAYSVLEAKWRRTLGGVPR